MRVFIAAPWADRAMLPAVAAQFEKAGHEITYRWWEDDDAVDPVGGPHSEVIEDRACADYVGVVQCQVLVLLNTQRSAGKDVETGMALALGKPVILVGERTNTYHHLGAVHPVFDVVQAIEWLA